jgi:hypothetical protein
MKIKRKLIIDQGFQFRSAFLLTGTCMVLAAFILVAMSKFAHEYFLNLDRDGAFINPAASRVFHEAWIQLLGILTGISVLYLAVTFVATLFITRSIVGPVVAYCSRVRTLIRSKREPQFYLRKTDELKMLEDVYSELAQYIEKLKKAA